MPSFSLSGKTEKTQIKIDTTQHPETILEQQHPLNRLTDTDSGNEWEDISTGSEPGSICNPPEKHVAGDVIGNPFLPHFRLHYSSKYGEGGKVKIVSFPNLFLNINDAENSNWQKLCIFDRRVSGLVYMRANQEKNNCLDEHGICTDKNYVRGQVRAERWRGVAWNWGDKLAYTLRNLCSLSQPSVDSPTSKENIKNEVGLCSPFTVKCIASNLWRARHSNKYFLAKDAFEGCMVHANNALKKSIDIDRDENNAPFLFEEILPYRDIKDFEDYPGKFCEYAYNDVLYEALTQLVDGPVLTKINLFENLSKEGKDSIGIINKNNDNNGLKQDPKNMTAKCCIRGNVLKAASSGSFLPLHSANLIRRAHLDNSSGIFISSALPVGQVVRVLPNRKRRLRFRQLLGEEFDELRPLFCECVEFKKCGIIAALPLPQKYLEKKIIEKWMIKGKKCAYSCDSSNETICNGLDYNSVRDDTISPTHKLALAVSCLSNVEMRAIMTEYVVYIDPERWPRFYKSWEYAYEDAIMFIKDCISIPLGWIISDRYKKWCSNFLYFAKGTHLNYVQLLIEYGLSFNFFEDIRGRKKYNWKANRAATDNKTNATNTGSPEKDIALPQRYTIDRLYGFVKKSNRIYTRSPYDYSLPCWLLWEPGYEVLVRHTSPPHSTFTLKVDNCILLKIPTSVEQTGAPAILLSPSESWPRKSHKSERKYMRPLVRRMSAIYWDEAVKELLGLCDEVLPCGDAKNNSIIICNSNNAIIKNKEIYTRNPLCRIADAVTERKGHTFSRLLPTCYTFDMKHFNELYQKYFVWPRKELARCGNDPTKRSDYVSHHFSDIIEPLLGRLVQVTRSTVNYTVAFQDNKVTSIPGPLLTKVDCRSVDIIDVSLIPGHIVFPTNTYYCSKITEMVRNEFARMARKLYDKTSLADLSLEEQKDVWRQLCLISSSQCSPLIDTQCPVFSVMRFYEDDGEPQVGDVVRIRRPDESFLHNISDISTPIVRVLGVVTSLSLPEKLCSVNWVIQGHGSSAWRKKAVASAFSLSGRVLSIQDNDTTLTVLWSTGKVEDVWRADVLLVDKGGGTLWKEDSDDSFAGEEWEQFFWNEDCEGSGYIVDSVDHDAKEREEERLVGNSKDDELDNKSAETSGGLVSIHHDSEDESERSNTEVLEGGSEHKERVMQKNEKRVIESALDAFDALGEDSSAPSDLSMQGPLEEPFTVLGCMGAHLLQDHEEVGLAAHPVAFMKRVQKEWKMLRETFGNTSNINSGDDNNHLSSSCYSKGSITIFLKVSESEPNLLKFAICGPIHTPYYQTLFCFDTALPKCYPDKPPLVRFYSTGLSLNPNLYADGEICLSLLATWPASEACESWSPKVSSISQVILSIQALILVNEPYYNEAGYEDRIGTPTGRVKSREYNEQAVINRLLYMMNTAKNPPAGWVLETRAHFSRFVPCVIRRLREFIDKYEKEEYTEKERSGQITADGIILPPSKGFVVALKSLLGQMEALHETLTKKWKKEMVYLNAFMAPTCTDV